MTKPEPEHQEANRRKLEERRARDLGTVLDSLWGDALTRRSGGTSPDERWLPVAGYEGLYEVSDLGRVRSLHGRSTSGVCFIGRDSYGYPTVAMNRNGKRATKTLHRLVALAFHGDKRNVLHCEVAHLDGSRTNARADNLKWVSKIENESHKRIHGTSQRGEGNGFAKLTDDAVREIRSYPPYKIDIKELARRFGVSRGAIECARGGRNWRHIKAKAPAAIAKGEE